MRVLLDTHAFLWFIWQDSKLSSAARSTIEDPANDVFVSAASIWEIGIKIGIGKLTLAEPLDVFLSRELPGNDFELLPIAIEHVAAVVDLPFHHRDPFDRMLIAQSITETVPLVSADAIFDDYTIRRLW
jgi:PIN domain nuclease of toxin-antitoxin system